MRINKQGFTFVEVIVVVVILSTLAVLGFVSYLGYAVSARDAVRLSDISNISKALETVVSSGERLPIPIDDIEITASGTLLSYQGYMGEQLLKNLGISSDGLDPSDEDYYRYSINYSQNKFQLLSFLEEPYSASILNNHQVFADNSERIIHTRGDKLGFLLDANNVPIDVINNSDIELITDTNEYTLIVDENDIHTGDKNEIISKLDFRFNTRGSCRAILLNGLSIGDGMYKLITSQNQSYNVYCDMTTDGGGWTLLASAIGEGTDIFSYDDIFPWTTQNSNNCGVDTECLSQSGISIDKWNDLLIYTRGYKVKGVGCNDRLLSIQDYTELPFLNQVSSSNWTNINNGAIGKCDEEYEVSQGLEVSERAPNNWPIHMGIMHQSNESVESSALYFGPAYMPVGLGNIRGSTSRKLSHLYGSTDKTGQPNDWDGASINKQVWFIR